MYFEVGLSLVLKEVVKFTFMRQSNNICAMLIFAFSKCIVCTFQYQKIWDMVNPMQQNRNQVKCLL